MSYIPLNFNQINMAVGYVQPSTIKNRNNKSFAFWERALFQRACSIIDFDGLPDDWSGRPKNLFYYALYKFGFLTIFDNAKFGLSFQPCTLSGYNFYYAPTNCIVSNPALTQSLDLKIGVDCELLQLSPDYAGLWDIIDYYAEKLSLIDCAINVALTNCKYPWILGGKTKGAVSALKKIVDKINMGDSAVFYDSRISDDMQTGESPFQEWHNTQDYITDKLLQDMQTIINNFDTEIGIPTVPYQKKERMVQAEAESKETESATRCTTYVNCLNDSFKIINKHFGTNMSAKLHFADQKGADDESGKNDDVGLTKISSV